MTDIIDDLKVAAAAKWKGNPAAQQAGLFPRAVAEIERLRAWLAIVKAERDALKIELASRGTA